jgi:hypothetical protein
MKADISLDHFRNMTKAGEYLTQLRANSRTPQHEILADYLQGRIYLFGGQHSMARLQFTRANRNARSGEWAERSRYFLALNDFYTGDFEFASIQMRPLERQSTSYYANDALRLRLWIQEGRQDDEPLPELLTFSSARFLFSTGQMQQAIAEVIPIITSAQQVPLKGEAILMAADYLRTVSPEATFALLNRILAEGFRGAQRERIMWERARIADGMYVQQQISATTLKNTIPDSVVPLIDWAVDASSCTAEELFFTNCGAAGVLASMSAAARTNHIIELYEDILFEFAQGFYADSIRARLLQLQQNRPS